MSKRTTVLVLLIILGVVITYCWQQSRASEFYPLLCMRCIQPVLYDNSFGGQLILTPQNEGDFAYFLFEMFSVNNMIYDLKTGQMYPLSNQVTGKFASSPDGKWLAYEELEFENGAEKRVWMIRSYEGKRRLVFRSYKGEERKIELGEGQSFVSWLDDHRVLLSEKRPDELPATVILDIGTMKSITFEPGYEDAISVEQHEFWSNVWPLAVYYAPDFKRGLYLANKSRKEEEYIDEYGFADLVLFDAKRQVQLVRFQDIYKLDSFEWGKDGLFLGLNFYNEKYKESKAEIWFLDRDGAVRWKIKMTDFFRASSIYEGLSYGGLSISPNGRYLSFDIGTPVGEQYRLFLDTRTGDIFDFCLESGYPSIWSPDSKYIALASGNPNYEKIETVIIDINKRSIYKIANEYIPVGWLRASK